VVNNTEQSQDNNEQQQEVVNAWGQTNSQEREQNSQNQTSQGAGNWDSSVSAPDVAPAATPTWNAETEAAAGQSGAWGNASKEDVGW